MRLVPIDNLPAEYDKINGEGSFALWLAEAESHLDNIRGLSPADRSAYWAKYNIWTQLYTTLSSISGNKCWYSESPENSGEWEIDNSDLKHKRSRKIKLLFETMDIGGYHTTGRTSVWRALW